MQLGKRLCNKAQGTVEVEVTQVPNGPGDLSHRGVPGFIEGGGVWGEMVRKEKEVYGECADEEG